MVAGWKRVATMFAVGAIVVTVVGYAALWLMTPSLNLFLCESREHDSSYGEASLRLAPPAVRCDFTGDRFFAEQGIEDRATGPLVLAPVIAIAGGATIGGLVGRRQASRGPRPDE